jgi:hypothetical protein
MRRHATHAKSDFLAFFWNRQSYFVILEVNGADFKNIPNAAWHRKSLTFDLDRDVRIITQVGTTIDYYQRLLMGLSIRIFIVEDDDTIKRLPLTPFISHRLSR